MKFSTIIKRVHRAARSAIAGLAISAALLGYPGGTPQPAAVPAVAPVVVSAPAEAPLPVPAPPSPAPVQGHAMVSVAVVSHGSVASSLAVQWFAPMLAQATFDSALQSFLGFISKILILLGIAVVFYGGWMVSQGKTSEGVTALVGGFIIAGAVLVIRVFAKITGTNF